MWNFQDPVFQLIVLSLSVALDSYCGFYFCSFRWYVNVCLNFKLLVALVGLGPKGRIEI